MGTSVRALRGLTRGSVLWGILLIAGCAVYHQAYVPGPLQPNNCGTPNSFKTCGLASNRPQKPVVVVEELQDTGTLHRKRRASRPVAANVGTSPPIKSDQVVRAVLESAVVMTSRGWRE